MSPVWLIIDQVLFYELNSNAYSELSIQSIPPNTTTECPKTAALWCEIFPGTLPLQLIDSQQQPFSGSSISS